VYCLHIVFIAELIVFHILFFFEKIVIKYKTLITILQTYHVIN
jgi:hypothetical protein